MILKKFLGKTIEAARKSARQMYGDDYLIVGSEPAGAGKEAGITIAVDEKQDRHKQPKQKSKNPAKNEPAERSSKGVRYEPSSQNGHYKNGTRYNPKNVSPNLQALRQYAEKQDQKKQFKNLKDNGKRESVPDKKPGTSFNNEKMSGSQLKEKTNSHYSRASVRNQRNGFQRHDESTPAKQEKGGGLLSQFDQSRPKFAEKVPAKKTPVRQEEREITALHKRFDKLEALLDSALISSNIGFVSHPAFQQLIHAGISTTAVSKWFGEILKDGVDPFEQNEMFMSKLSAIIREALTIPVPDESRKFMLFAGPSGSGKTALIMKLVKHPEFFLKKETAVVAMIPRDTDDHYYTILEPFCKENSIPFFKVSSGEEVTQLQDEWSSFDKVLLDTPSISIQQESSFREYWKIRQIFASLTPLEVHYVVNASLNQFYFRDSSSMQHPLHPDYVAITHLDEAKKWGPLIPFFADMGCGARYISSGRTIPDSLSKFEPASFAQQVLQNR
jgi:flagellar biosynthesis GTPase FlhF